MHFSTLFSYCPVCGSSHFNLNNIKSKRCDACGFVYYVNPSAAVAGFILNEDGDLLVCRRGKQPAKGTWDLPGGFVDENETAEQAAIREIHEELNGEVVQLKYLFSVPNLYEYSGLSIPTLDLFFDCRLKDVTNLLPADDVDDYFFVPFNKINPENFGLNSIRHAIIKFLEQR